MSLKLVFISDTHNAIHNMDIPDGDVLIHSGDATMWGTEEEIDTFIHQFLDLPHKHKIFVPGNHDFGFEDDQAQSIKFGMEAHYLVNSGIEIDGYKFYGSPAQGDLSGWAWYCKNKQKLKAHWDKIPDDTDVLITHVPPHLILDELAQSAMERHGNTDNPNIGCPYLRAAVLTRVKPTIHAFGHIHEGYGAKKIEDTTFINSAVMDENYHRRNKPIIAYLNKGKNKKV